MTSVDFSPRAQDQLAPAGFWRRFAAFLVDGLLLALVGNALGFALFDAMVWLGAWGRVLGFVIALAYFVPLESRFGGGRSLGKHWLGIRVVDAAGRALAPARAAARFAIFGVPYFLSGAALPVRAITFARGVPLALLSFGAFTALVYLLVFNRRTRQSLHDLATGSFVVRVAATPAAGVAAVPLWRGHRAVVIALFVLAGALPLAAPKLLRMPLRAGLAALDERVAAQPEVRSATVFETSSRRYGVGGESTLRALLIEAAVDAPIADGDPLATRLAGLALASLPGAEGEDLIVVRLSHGFDLGIASSWDSREFSRDPGQWRDRVAAGVGG